MRIMIYGAPGVGKSTASRLLHAKTGIELCSGDYLREVKMPQEIGKSDDPFLFMGTKQAWRIFGDLTTKNAIKGLKAVRKSMQPYIKQELARYEDVIFEAAFLNPQRFQDSKLYLVTTLDADKHRKQFFQAREYFHPRYGSEELEEGFRASRLIQDYLIEEAQKIKASILSNDDSENRLIEQLQIFSEL